MIPNKYGYNRNGLKECRELAQHDGLTFYPTGNDKNRNSTKHKYEVAANNNRWNPPGEARLWPYMVRGKYYTGDHQYQFICNRINVFPQLCDFIPLPGKVAIHNVA